MRHALSLLSLITAGGLVLFTTPCTAEKPMYDKPVITLSGGIIAPAAPQERIRMDLMQINIRMQTGSYILDAVFHLFNTGETTTEWVGFPKHGTAVPSLSEGDPLIHDFIRYDCWVDDRKEVFVEELSLMHDSCHLFPEPEHFRVATKWMGKKISFPKNTVTTIRVRLEAPYNDDDKIRSVPVRSGYFFFGPGQYWKGKIGKAEIVLTNPDSDNKDRWMVFDIPETTIMKRIVTKMETRQELRELQANANGYVTFGQHVYQIKKNGGMHLTQPTTTCSMWAWRTTPERLWSSSAASQPRKHAVNISLRCGGPKGFVVHGADMT